MLETMRVRASRSGPRLSAPVSPSSLFLAFTITLGRAVWRAGHGAGKGNYCFYFKMSLLLFIFAAIISIVIMFFRDYISYIYTGGDDVAAAMLKLTPLLALTLILNGIQPVLSGSLLEMFAEHLLSLSQILLLGAVPVCSYFAIRIYERLHLN